MTPWQHRETVANKSQGMEPTMIHPVVVNSEAPPTIPKMDTGIAAHDGSGSSAMLQDTPIVFVVDDDVSVRKSLELQIRAAKWRPETFATVREFLNRERAPVPSCLIIRIAQLCLNDLDFSKRLAADRKAMPIILVTDHGDVAMTVQAMKAGVFDFFTKPFCDDALLSTIWQAIERSRAVLDHEVELRELRGRYTSLSRREQEVMTLVISGMLNKQVAFELDISEITVKAHRGRVMQKMKAGSFADLVRMALELRVSAAGQG